MDSAPQSGAATPHVIVEKGSAVYKTHPNISTPPAETRLWRYMDVTKLISLLGTDSLYFPRSDLLGDPWEGAVSNLTIKCRERFPVEMHGGMADFNKAITRQTFISCWHRNDYESAAMWKLYLKSDEGVAISTTCDRLSRCFKDGTPYDIFIGEVDYLDYTHHVVRDGNVLQPFFSKRRSFIHENEVRAIVSPLFQTPPPTFVSLEPPNGIALAIDATLLIEDVFAAPETPDWIRDALQSVLDRFNLNRNVRRSSMSESPRF
jgi:hypothetical protein